LTSSALAQEKLSDGDFRYLSQLVYEQTGIVLGQSKREMVCRRLLRRMRALNVVDYKGYCNLLKGQGSSDGELANFVNAITTNLTSFFREEHHFRYLEHYLADLVGQAVTGQRLRIWSAACSTGEEAYSLAMTVVKAIPDQLDSWDIKILATDLDTNVLDVARQGIYEADVNRVIPVTLFNRYFSQGVGENAGLVRIKPPLRQMITFNQLNLMHAWPMKGPFDVIMCRNVMIYFDRETQLQLLTRFIQLLRPGGLLFLGHSETAGKAQSELLVKGRTIYQRAS